MTGWSFVLKGVRHYRAAYLGVLAGAAVGAMVLLGALMAGDSVNGSLREAAELRTGKVEKVFAGGERFFRSELAEGRQAPVLFLEGQVNVGERGEGQVQVLGVTNEFFGLGPVSDGLGGIGGTEVGVSETLARALDLTVGDGLVVRVPKPGLLSRDAPLSGEGESVVSMRGKVGRIVSDESFGRFGLKGTQVPPSSVFVSLEHLQKAVELEGQGNLLLMPEGDEVGGLLLEDYGISVVELPGGVDVRSKRIFLEPGVVDGIRQELTTNRVLTYLVNTLKTQKGETPYSMVGAVENVSFFPELSEGEVVLNSWLAEDLQAGVGDSVSMTYFVVEGGSRLAERTSDFVVKAIIPLEGEAADKRWMPEFPGVADVKSARDWEPGLPLDLKRIRDKDDDYWEKYKGTPKAWVSYEAGAQLWGNRWGKVTGLRVPGGAKAEVEKKVLSVLSPSLAGMHVLDFKEQAEKAAKSPVDFAGLFLSMGFFLIIAALALVAMLFRFSVEQRAEENGLLSALGISSKRLRRWRLTEAFVVVLCGGVIGAGLAVGFCLAVLKVVGSIWDSGSFVFHGSSTSVVGGLMAFVVLALGVVWWSLRKMEKQSASVRLSGAVEERSTKSRGKWKTVAYFCSGVLAVAGLFMGPPAGFFLMGVGLLWLGLLLFRRSLEAVRSFSELTLANLAGVNLGRRKSRGFTVVMVLAMGVFMVLSVASFRKDGGAEWKRKDGGAGGYGLWVETTAPVNRPADALGEMKWFGMEDGVVPVRIGAGDDVDCFNLNSSDRPRLLGVDPALLKDRFQKDAEWSALNGEGVPAFVDETTMMWVLKKTQGDRLQYVDEWGQPFEVTIAGVLKDSVFQGSLIIAENKMLEKYPSTGGYQLFLVEDENARAELQSATADLGGKVTTTRERLAAFHEVENTYIAIFNVLGGLGMVLASVGVGVVTARNLLERKGEFQVMEVLGISDFNRSKLVMLEVGRLITWGLGIGFVASMCSVLPLLGKSVSGIDLAMMLGLLVLMGVVAWLSATLARVRVGV